MAGKVLFENSLSFARSMDKGDPLIRFRKQFHIPRRDGKRSIYFTGNSLGLQPITAKDFVLQEMNDWSKLGVDGHLHAKRPWVYYHHLAKKSLAKLVGAKATEVVAMNQLTVNLHLMMVSFFRPTKQRYKILTEAGAFPSDQYALESQLQFHGLNPATSLIELHPRSGEHTLRTEDIIDAIGKHGSSLALVLFGAVQYYTGQFFDIKAITNASREVGATVGFDLAHAIGNVPLDLHKDEVDFAVWCSYKYLNSGPGGIAGAFVHEKHATALELPRFAGWWGHDEDERFQMKKGFKPMSGVDGWQLSNVPVLQAAAHLASLKIFDQAGIRRIRAKSVQLTGYLEFLLRELNKGNNHFEIITPQDSSARGSQLSILVRERGNKIFERLIKNGVIADWREPNVIRVAPAPLYNSFEDVFRFAEIFKNSLNEK
jgi:kynureninase